MAEPGKYTKDGVTRVANDKAEANALVWQGFKLSGSPEARAAAKSASSADKSRPAAKKAATKKPSETGTTTVDDDAENSAPSF